MNNKLNTKRLECARPLTADESAEYVRLFNRWTANGGRGALRFSPEKVKRFAELSDALCAWQRSSQ